MGAKYRTLNKDDQHYSRIKVGDPDDLIPDMGRDDHCRDCNARTGQYHHVGCALERCPICREQFFLCGCVPHAYINTITDDCFF